MSYNSSSLKVHAGTQGVSRLGHSKGYKSPTYGSPPGDHIADNEWDTPGTSDGSKKIDIDTSPISNTTKPLRFGRPWSAEHFPAKSNAHLASPHTNSSRTNGEIVIDSSVSKKTRVAWGGPGTTEAPTVVERGETIPGHHYKPENRDRGTLRPTETTSPGDFPREHDKETLSILRISFPPSTTPTLGLTRAVRPPQSQLQRYSNLIENAIGNNMVAPLSRLWKNNTHNLLSRELRQDFKEVMDELDEVYMDNQKLNLL